MWRRIWAGRSAWHHRELTADFEQHIAFEREEEEVVCSAEPQIEQAAGAGDAVGIQRAGGADRGSDRADAAAASRRRRRGSRQ